MGVIIVNVVIVVYVDVNAITIIKKSLLLNLVQPMIQYFTLGTCTHDHCDSHIQQPHHKMGKYNSMIMTIIMAMIMMTTMITTTMAIMMQTNPGSRLLSIGGELAQ